MANLPQPTPEQQALSQRLCTAIQHEIARNGPIPFAQYMDMALYAPGLGYYAAGQRKFGPDGDFVTAPEISSLFSHCLARQCAEILAVTHGGILELGAGSGRMAMDVLTALSRMGLTPEYWILEPSAELQQRQQHTLAQAQANGSLPHAHVRWLDRLPPAGSFNGVMLANEVLDAMPVHRFCWAAQQWQEWRVDWSAEALRWTLATPSAALAAACAELATQTEAWRDGYSSEICLALPSWFADLWQCSDQAVMLLLDYGFPRHEYYHPQREQGTLMCHYRHHAHGDPFFWPGVQDITCHVDFSHAAQSAQQAGWEVLGYTRQADFLLALGLLEQLAAEHPAVPTQEQPDAAYWRAVSGVKTLLLPEEMGELFKVLALAKLSSECTLPPLRGLALTHAGRL